MKNFKFSIPKKAEFIHADGFTSYNGHWASKNEWVSALVETRATKSFKERVAASVQNHVLAALNGSLRHRRTMQSIMETLDLKRRKAFALEGLEVLSHPDHADLKFVKIENRFYDCSYIALAFMDTGLVLLPPSKKHPNSPLAIMKNGELVALIMHLNQGRFAAKKDK